MGIILNHYFVQIISQAFGIWIILHFVIICNNCGKLDLRLLWKYLLSSVLRNQLICGFHAISIIIISVFQGCIGLLLVIT